MTEITCVGNAGTTFYSAEFSCAAQEAQGGGGPDAQGGRLPGAVAVLGEESEDCLGGTPVAGTWVHGIQLFLMCDGEPDPIGICDPEESIGMNNACSLGFTCANGDCTNETLTIPDISSTIENADCSITASPTSSPAPSAAPTAAESAEPSISFVPTESPAPTDAPTVTASPTITMAPSVKSPDTTMPTGAAVPSGDVVTPTAEGGSEPTMEVPATPTGGEVPGATEPPTETSASSIKSVTVVSMLIAAVMVLVGSF